MQNLLSFIISMIHLQEILQFQFRYQFHWVKWIQQEILHVKYLYLVVQLMKVQILVHQVNIDVVKYVLQAVVHLNIHSKVKNLEFLVLKVHHMEHLILKLMDHHLKLILNKITQKIIHYFIYHQIYNMGNTILRSVAKVELINYINSFIGQWLKLKELMLHNLLKMENGKQKVMKLEVFEKLLIMKDQ